MKKNNDKVIIGLKKAKSLLDKIIEMKVQDKYCIDIIQQNLAVIGLLKSANLQLMKDHLNCCFVDGVRKGNKKEIENMMDEIINIIKTAQNK